MALICLLATHRAMKVQFSFKYHKIFVSKFGFSEYLGDATLIPKNTSVIVRRVPSSRPHSSLVPQLVTQYKPAIKADTSDASSSEACRIHQQASGTSSQPYELLSLFFLSNYLYCFLIHVLTVFLSLFFFLFLLALMLLGF